MADRTDLEQLVYQMSANTTQLEKDVRKALDVVKKNTRSVQDEFDKSGKTAWQKFSGGAPDADKALEKVFSRTRFALIEQGGAKIGVFGSALEALGPAGLLAGASLIALGVGLEQAHKALEFADGLYKAAQVAHLTTDELQELQFALREAGGDGAKAGSAMQQFSVHLGEAQANMPRALRAFRELFGTGFTAADAKKLGDAGQAIDTIVAKIATIKNVSQKDAVIEQLGLQDLKPLIEQGVDKFRDLRAAAEATGQVMDQHLVVRGHELNLEVDRLKTKIDVDLHSAFVQLGPVLVKLLGYLADMSDKALIIADAMSPLQARSTKGLEREARGLEARAKTASSYLYGGPGADLARAAAARAELARRKATGEDNIPALPGGNGVLADGGKPKGPTEAEKRAKGREALDEAEKDELAAQAALTEDVQKLAALKTAEVDRETDKKNQQLKAEIAGGKINAALAEQAIAENKKAADLKKEKIAQDAVRALQDNLIAQAQERHKYEDDELASTKDLAKTSAQRAALELELFRRRMLDERTNLASKLQKDVDEGKQSQESADATFAAFDKNAQAQAAAIRRSNAGPLSKFVLDAPKTIDQLNESFQQFDAEGLANLNSGLADAIVNAKSLGDVGAQVFKQLAVQVLQVLFQAGEAKALSYLGFADGGQVRGPGGPRSDVIPAMLSNGEYVVNAHSAARFRSLLEAINSGQAPHLAMGGSIGMLRSIGGPVISGRGFRGGATVIENHYHLDGAVMASELWDRIDQGDQVAALRGGSLGHQQTMKYITQSRRKLGRG